MLWLISGADVLAQWDTEKSLPGVNDRWSRYESPNFELYSDNLDREARAILHDLEVLRAIFFNQMKFVERNRLPVTVYAFRRGSDYTSYANTFSEKQKSTAGKYLRRPDRAVIMLRPMEERDSARRVVFHEYVHHLFRAVGEDPPLWFNEGMAELFAGIKIEKDRVEIGHPVGDRLLPLRQSKLMPLETLFRVEHGSKHYESDNHAGIFYAQSWALLHYWKFGDSKIDPEGVHRFIAVAGRKEALARTNIQSLFEACFGMNYKSMLRRLDRYVRKGRYHYGEYPLPDIPAADSYPRAAMTAAHMRVRLAELAVRTRRDGVGQLVLMQEGEAEYADPRIFETLGGDAWAHGDNELGLQYWRRAVELGSINSVILRGVASSEWNRWFSNYLPTLRLPQEVADDLRSMLVSSIELEPVQDEAYQMLAWVEGFMDEPNLVNMNAVQERFKHMQKKDRTLLALAMCRDRLGFQAQAIDLLKQINRFDPDEWTLKAAEQTLALWEGKDPSEVYLGEERDTERIGASRLSQNINRLPSVPVPVDL